MPTLESSGSRGLLWGILGKICYKVLCNGPIIFFSLFKETDETIRLGNVRKQRYDKVSAPLLNEGLHVSTIDERCGGRPGQSTTFGNPAWLFCLLCTAPQTDWEGTLGLRYGQRKL